ncbi:hypothetical protein OB955_02090 [Halobacteria archaeon AArc-m2/3/4]|uniref:DUF7969 domain-containing protein n=1 Tax=Natronoglomus mannanivorans TaxID=2979990 RepID=A0ABT2Q9E8_9EURY|nr:hypothetical protein [Halobacteria archaeon AArc-m2/3/4]
MTVTVSYTCPNCGALTYVERRADLADKSVTTTPQAGWEYATPDDDLESIESADGIAFRCGENGDEGEGEDGAEESVDGCGRPFYLNFVRFEHGVELEPDPPTYDGPRFDFRP